MSFWLHFRCRIDLFINSTGFGGGNFYTLTQNGLRVCHKLFHVKFSPDVNAAYALVRPRANCVATPDGHIQIIGPGGGVQNAPLPVPAARAGRDHNPVARGFDPYGGQDDYSDEDDGYGDFYIPPPAGGGFGVGGAVLAGARGGRGIKRTRSDVDLFAPGYGGDDGDEEDDGFGYHPAGDRGFRAEPEMVDVDLMRAKRLRHFEHMTHSAAGPSSSSAVKARPAATPPVHCPAGSSTGAVTGGGEGDDAEAEALRNIELQSLLEYSEQQAQAEAARWEEERVMEAYVLSTALEESLVNERVPSRADGRQKAPSDVNRYEEFGAFEEYAEEREEGGGTQDEDEDYRRAVAESIKLSASAQKAVVPSSRARNHGATPVPARTIGKVGCAGLGTGAGAGAGTERTVIELDTSTAPPAAATPRQRQQQRQTPAAQAPSAASGWAVTSPVVVIDMISGSHGDKSRVPAPVAVGFPVPVSVPVPSSSSSMNAAPAVVVVDLFQQQSSEPSTTTRSPSLTGHQHKHRSQDQQLHLNSANKGTVADTVTSAAARRPARCQHQQQRRDDVINIDDDDSMTQPTRPPLSLSQSSSTSQTSQAAGLRGNGVATLHQKHASSLGGDRNNGRDRDRDTVRGDGSVGRDEVIELLDDSQELDAEAVAEVIGSAPSKILLRSPSSSSSSSFSSSPAASPATSRTYRCITGNRSKEVITIEDSQLQDAFESEPLLLPEDSSWSLGAGGRVECAASRGGGDSGEGGAGGGSAGGGLAMLSAYAAFSSTPATASCSTPAVVPSAPATQPLLSSSSTAVAAVATFVPLQTVFVHQRTVLQLSLSPAQTESIVQVNAHKAPAATIPREPVPAPARRQLVLLVDTRERFVQNKYRQFFFDITTKCAARLPAMADDNHIKGGYGGDGVNWRTEQDKLELGDLAIAYELDAEEVDPRLLMQKQTDDYQGFVTESTGNTDKPRKNGTKKTNTKNRTTAAETSEDQRMWMSDVIVERKALSDLISRSAGDFRSRCGTAAHMVQEMRLRQSGLKHSFMLLEGCTNAANLHAVPLTWSDRELTHPDVIDSQEGIVSYMCAVLARNYSPRASVRVLQTLNNSTTCLLASALLAVEMFLGPPSTVTADHRTAYTSGAFSSATTTTATSSASSVTSGATSGTASRGSSSVHVLSQADFCERPTKQAFDKYCRQFGAEKRGKEAELRQSLATPVDGAVVSREMIERIVRRFGCWDALLRAYRECYTAVATHASPHQESSSYIQIQSQAVAAEVKCGLLLCELTVGGTFAERRHLTSHNAAAADFDSDCDESVASAGAGGGAEADSDPEGGGSWSASSVLLEDSLSVWARGRCKLVQEGFLLPNPLAAACPVASSTVACAVALADELLVSAHPKKVTVVTLSSTMATGILCHHGSLDSRDFTVLSAEGGHSSSRSSSSSTSSASPSLSVVAVTARDEGPAKKRTKKNSDAAAGGLCTYLNYPDGKFPFLTLQSVDRNEYVVVLRGQGATEAGIRRKSMRMCVAVVSGFDVVEVLVQATSAHKAMHRRGVGNTGNRAVLVNTFASAQVSVDVVCQAIRLLADKLPPCFRNAGSENGEQRETTTPAQCVLVVESLVHPTSSAATAIGRLSRAVNASSAQGIEEQVSLGEGRPLLSADDARDVSANEAWLVQLFLACVSTYGSWASVTGSAGSTCASGTGSTGERRQVGGKGEGEVGGGGGGWQCFLTPNADQTERCLFALIHEMQRQSLLLF